MRAESGEIARLAAGAASAGELDLRNVQFLTALHLAVVVDRPDIVGLLVSLGASLNLQEERHGDTVVHLVCRLDRGKCLCAIVDALLRRTTAQRLIEHDLKAILHSFNYDGNNVTYAIWRLGVFCLQITH